MFRRPMTLTQKILADHAIGLARPWVEAGDFLRVRVDWTIASELAWNGMNRTYTLLGRPPIHDPNRFYLAIDHTVDPITLAEDPTAKRLTRLSRDFAKESGIRHFYDANETILHTKFYRDLLQPGELVLGADSHTSSHGGLGAFAIGLGGADIAAAMVLGESWIEVPEAIAVEFAGEPPFGISGKEIILRTLGDLGRNTVAMARTVEYVGDATRAFSTDMRFTIANMTAEFGGLNGVFEADGWVSDWLSRRSSHSDQARYFRADENAPYLERHRIDLARAEPMLALPYAPDNVAPAADHVGTALDGVFVGACTTTEEELVLAALVLERALEHRDAPPAEGKRLVVPGSLEIVERLEQRGLLDLYRRAGFRIGPPGCSMCLGVASDRAERGEVWLTSQNRNFPNRMGAGSDAWLASGATAAASSLNMAITDARPILAEIDRERFERLLDRSGSNPPPVVPSEPEMVVGEPAAEATSVDNAGLRPIRARIQRFGDHVDTDAIIPGEFCHLTSMDELGDACFHHVAPGFRQRVAGGAAIVVAGEGWGSGSSREQAVWALQGAGVEAVIAKSFAFIHKRNLVNDALPHLVITDQRFYELAQEAEEIEIDPATREVVHLATGERFRGSAPAPIVGALLRAGGLVPAIRAHGVDVFGVLASAGTL
ncbi:MAG: 3-isopropylmalate dehydratase [Gemmatimonadetes bacterium]|nr:3-isopropylmalate dehydratase [Gemmatimonadota bacterium]